VHFPGGQFGLNILEVDFAAQKSYVIFFLFNQPELAKEC
jgi:hypothetical protein